MLKHHLKHPRFSQNFLLFDPALWTARMIVDSPPSNPFSSTRRSKIRLAVCRCFFKPYTSSSSRHEVMKARTSSVSTDASRSGVLRSQGTFSPSQYFLTVLREIPVDLAMLRWLSHLDCAAGFVCSRSLKLPPLSPLNLRLNSE